MGPVRQQGGKDKPRRFTVSHHRSHLRDVAVITSSGDDEVRVVRTAPPFPTQTPRHDLLSSKSVPTFPSNPQNKQTPNCSSTPGLHKQETLRLVSLSLPFPTHTCMSSRAEFQLGFIMRGSQGTRTHTHDLKLSKYSLLDLRAKFYPLL